MGMTAAERSARYRDKDVDEYRRKKREYAKTPDQRLKRTEYMRKYRDLHRDKTNEQARTSHNRTREGRTPDQRHNEHLKAWYGITREQYLEMLEGQGGKCAICGSDTARWKKQFHVDHCHKTHLIRGLLCNRCNPMLGWLESHMDQIQQYLSQDLTGRAEVRNPAKKRSSKQSSTDNN